MESAQNVVEFSLSCRGADYTKLKFRTISIEIMQVEGYFLSNKNAKASRKDK